MPPVSLTFSSIFQLSYPLIAASFPSRYSAFQARSRRQSGRRFTVRCGSTSYTPVSLLEKFHSEFRNRSPQSTRFRMPNDSPNFLSCRGGISPLFYLPVPLHSLHDRQYISASLRANHFTLCHRITPLISITSHKESNQRSLSKPALPS